MLRIVLADILLFIGIIIADPLFFHHRRQFGAAAACAAIVYLGPPLLYRLKSEMRERREKKER